MKAFIYLLQVSACTGTFYAFYFLFLRRLTFFTLNRWYLLGTLLLSFVIPALTFTVEVVKPSPMMEPVFYVQNITQAAPVVVQHAAQEARPEKTFDWMNVLRMVYIGVAIASLTQLLYSLAAFVKRARSRQLMELGRVKVVKATPAQGNSSFLNVIFINDDELEPAEIQQIITHELLHVKLMHSADRLIARIVQIGLWFNPFAYLYMRSMEENHEFEVDRIAAGDDERGIYAQLLLKLAVSGRGYLFHSFSKVPLKKRITMLFNKPTSNMKRIIYLLVLPVVVASCLAFANLQPGGKLSIINDLSNLGEKPLVLIDGKEYSTDMIYKIGGKCVLTTSTYSAPVSVAKYKKYAGKMNDGLVVITTLNGKITYQTAAEKYNLAKKAAVPQNQFFTRLQLKAEDGSVYEEGIVKLPKRGSMSREFKVGSKVVFLLADKAYPETEVAMVEELVKKYEPKSYSVGPVKGNEHLINADYSAYETFYYFDVDTTKYRQKVWRNGKRLYPNRKAFEDYSKSEQGMRDKAASERVAGNTLVFKVTGAVDTTYGNLFAGHVVGYKVMQGNNEYVLQAKGDYKAIEGLLHPGDEIEMKVEQCTYGNNSPLIIFPQSISKGGTEIYRAKKVGVPQHAFLYEANKVRFTDGKLLSVNRYANGSWKSAVILAPNGSKIIMNIKPTAPAFENITIGEAVRFRFVHEVKTGNDYVVNDWVSLTKGYMGYGVKNPEYFYKFYEKV